MQISVTKQAGHDTSMQYRCVAIVAASEFNSDVFVKMYEAGSFADVIAADAGFSHLQKLGITPEVVVGDFDTLGNAPKPADGMEIVTLNEDKDWTDLEVALDKAQAQGPARIYLFGALGGRVDMTISTFQMLASAANQGSQITAIGTNQSCFCLAGPAAVNFENITLEDQARAISIVSLSDHSCGIASMGFKWNYGDANSELTNTKTLGISNQFAQNKASLTVEAGNLLVVY